MVYANNEKMCDDVIKTLEAQNIKKIDKDFILMLVERYTQVTKNIVKYRNLPSDFEYVVIEAVLEAYNRLGHEGIYSRNELSISTTYGYKDIVDSIRQKTRGRINPASYLGYY